MNIAEAYDLQDRVTEAEKELSIVRNKLKEETRKSRRHEQQKFEYMDAHARALQDCNMLSHHFQLVSGSHLALSKEFEKAKLMVETLEAVIRMLYISSCEISGGKDSMASDKQLAADRKD